MLTKRLTRWAVGQPPRSRSRLPPMPTQKRFAHRSPCGPQEPDPIWTTAYITRNHGYMVYDTLFAVDQNLNPTQMVDTWKISDDGLVYTFTLRDGLMWHDGKPVTSADCVHLALGQGDGMGQKFMDFTKSSVDDKTFTLTLKEPYGLVLDRLARSA